MVSIVEIFEENICAARLNIASKEQLLKHCAQVASTHACARGIKEAAILKAIHHREHDHSTGFGNGIAIPHARIPNMKSFILFIITLKKGIPFDAIDKKPVDLVFIMLGPAEEVQEHLRILAFISRCIAHTTLCDDLRAATTTKQISESFLRNASMHSSPAKHARSSISSSLLLINIYREEYLEEILELLLEYDIGGSTILETTGMGHYLSKTPLFGNFIGCMQESKYHSHTVIAVSPKEKVSPLIDEIESIVGDIDKNQHVSIIALDIDAQRGSMNVV